MAEYNSTKHYIAGALTPFVGGASILFNSVVLFTIIKRQDRTRLGSLLLLLTLVYLAVAGFHAILSITTAVVTGLGAGTDVFNDFVCSVLGVCSYMFDNVSILLLALIAVDRWQAILRPTMYNLQVTLSKSYKFAILGCFLMPALFAFLSLLGGFTFNQDTGKCVIVQHHRLLTIICTFLFRFVPILIILISVLKLRRPLQRFKETRRQGAVPTEPLIIEQARSYNPVSFEFPPPNNLSSVSMPHASVLELRAAESMVRLLIAGMVLGLLETVLILLGMDLLIEGLAFQYLFTLAHPSLIPLMLLAQKNAFNITFCRLLRRCACCVTSQRRTGQAQFNLNPHFRMMSNNDIEKSCIIDDRLPAYLKRPHTVDMRARIQVDVSTVEADPTVHSRVKEDRKESEHLLHPRRASLYTGSHRTFENDDISSIDSLRVMIDADKLSLSACSTITLSHSDRPDHRHSLSFHHRKPSQFSTSSEWKQQAKTSNAFSHNLAVEIHGRRGLTPISPLGIVTDSHFSASFDHPETPTSPSSRVTADVTRWVRSSGTVNRPRGSRTCVSLQETTHVDRSGVKISSSTSSTSKDGSQKSEGTPSPTRVTAFLKRHTLCESPFKQTDLPPVEQISVPPLSVIAPSTEC